MASSAHLFARSGNCRGAGESGSVEVMHVFIKCSTLQHGGGRYWEVVGSGLQETGTMGFIRRVGQTQKRFCTPPEHYTIRSDSVGLMFYKDLHTFIGYCNQGSGFSSPEGHTLSLSHWFLISREHDWLYLYPSKHPGFKMVVQDLSLHR